MAMGCIISLDQLPSGRRLVGQGSAKGGSPLIASHPRQTTAVNRYKFTGKERDTETGLDYFGARYYASSMGRYLSPDWSEAPQPVPYADFGNPQTLNLYQYVGNNPITTFDADGHCWPPSACADALDSFVQTFRQDGLAANDRTSSPTLAAINTFANGVVGDLASGAADVLRLGNGTAAAIDSAKQGDYLGAAANLAQDGGRAATVILTVTAIGARANAPTGDTLQPGPHADGSVPASGTRITTAERAQVNQIGNSSGCHSCGASSPGTKSGNFVGDHQPPTALAKGRPQSLYPQCLNCSRVQGGQTTAAVRAGQQIPPRQPPPPLVRQKKPEEN
jgi:RHS repeat-associated protein